MKAIFVKGNPEYRRYIPEDDVEAGDIIIVGDVPVVAHSPIKAGEEGNVAIGGGCYLLELLAAVAVGKAVYTNNDDNMSGNPGDGVHFGFMNLYIAATDANQIREVEHRPSGLQIPLALIEALD